MPARHGGSKKCGAPSRRIFFPEFNKARRGRNSSEQTPLLSKGGVDATPRKCREASLLGADGVVGSITKTNLFELEQHHPVCAVKEASRHFLRGAATPPLLRRGVLLV